VRRSELFYLLVGAALYYGFLRFRGTIAGMPWKPVVVAA
jgi:hypothetical protein